MKQCVGCAVRKKDDDMMLGDKGESVCETCYNEADPIATVVYSDPRKGELEAQDGNSMNVITEYHNSTDFEVEYVKTDGWRGYYEVKKSAGWTNVHGDTILAHSEDEHELKNFDEKLEDFCAEKGIAWAKVFCRTSNVFSSGYDFFVPDENVNDVKAFVEKLKGKHRDPARFNSTALTGADPADQTKEDKQFVMAAGLMNAGSSPEAAVAMVKMLDIISKPKEAKKNV